MPNTKPITTTNTRPLTTAEADTRFPHERLDVYAVAEQLVGWVARHRQALHGLPGEAGPQLERASVRALLNIAEAAGRQGLRDKARVFAIARGETCEAAAALNVAVLYGALTLAQAGPARTLLIRQGQMLSRIA